MQSGLIAVKARRASFLIGGFCFTTGVLSAEAETISRGQPFSIDSRLSLEFWRELAKVVGVEAPNPNGREWDRSTGLPQGGRPEKVGVVTRCSDGEPESSQEKVENLRRRFFGPQPVLPTAPIRPLPSIPARLPSTAARSAWISPAPSLICQRADVGWA